MPTAIDLFAGAGGFSQGARQVGVQVVWAANHNPVAVEYHSRNHPGAVHACQDLHQADWSQVPEHEIMLASPCCQGHSHARGKDRPHHDAQRSTAWAVVSCAEFHRQELVVVENVPEFTRWVLYPAWLSAMHALGYAIAPYVIDAASHGVAQNRERLFLVCTRSKHPLELQLPERNVQSIGDLIEWDAYPWSQIDKPGRSAATLRRIDAGRRDFGSRFVAAYYGNTHTGRSLHRPIGTITTRDRWAIIDGDNMRMLQPSEARKAMGFPDGYELPAAKRDAMQLLGNAVCPPVAADILRAALAA